ncbi:hypothetical protein [uncultured Acetobacteroides sp.]|uniref:hypothetical protein n=1 Tax=uncultured Acetobacteroides sp. TaxID=1760811 RepID=UPI0029F558DF|nr:hypothetical protein [uncultured Acetobacteroides sp.]
MIFQIQLSNFKKIIHHPHQIHTKSLSPLDQKAETKRNSPSAVVGKAKASPDAPTFSLQKGKTPANILSAASGRASTDATELFLIVVFFTTILQ